MLFHHRKICHPQPTDPAHNNRHRLVTGRRQVGGRRHRAHAEGEKQRQPCRSKCRRYDEQSPGANNRNKSAERTGQASERRNGLETPCFAGIRKQAPRQSLNRPRAAGQQRPPIARCVTTKGEADAPPRKRIPRCRGRPILLAQGSHGRSVTSLAAICLLAAELMHDRPTGARTRLGQRNCHCPPPAVPIHFNSR